MKLLAIKDAIDSFPGGVYVDSAGVMRRISLENGGRNLARIRAGGLQSNGNQDVKKTSTMRKVSLTRLEREMQIQAAFGKQPTEAMKALAGIRPGCC